MKVALIQQKFHQNKKDTINKTCEFIKQAKKENAELVCLQELHQTQYFCQSENVDFFDLANDYEKDINFWSEVARENEIVLVTSLFEKRSAGLYHNTSVVFEKDGKLAGKYRKMHIPDDPCFYEKFYFTQGDLGFEPIKTSLGKLGVLVCWDQWYPEAARIMALKGAQILIYPTAIGWFDKDDKEEKQRQLNAWINIQRAHAIANGLPVVSINRVGFEKDESGVEDGIRFWGNSFVFGAQGEELFMADNENELCKIVDINMQRCENVRRWWPFLRDRRIEFYNDLTKRFID
ncbi:N-carbamoylputrescine amidohydrolase [Campylobacter volucris]|uniref:N-carbamoylputrescine amidohydrolase n=1 Tax=Campylobacter volucris TaxID=1031542 RepID=A0AAE5YGL0_9BACT|nr:N-carbamoylputrescine amidohydrolase [Campylobacter volucris]AJC94172.1 N-carbamoylputrescine amidohydrolase [Campylobacter volucris LMG 24379]KAB0580330.1 N-carbamoylputrescine amidohydrolase [Campylobacter volucris]QBL13456.1 N-carbamoylputrescine amidohydrolase [Campylobacter volucris]QEL08388.1 N-carbamoylputrescine amidohydrolase [Campylobacter volucris]TXK70493.1 N-carbamoylputrescine amidohydrolase [Campylobacter volucris]